MGISYAKAKVIICSSRYKKALRYHSHEGDEEIIRQLIKEGVDVNMGVDEDNHRAIHHVAKGGHRDCVKVLVENGADINSQNNFGLTALHCACQKEHIQTIRELIDRGADLDKRDRFGWTPLHYACQKGCSPAIRVLKEKGADLNALTKWDWTPVHVAARWGRSSCLKELLKDDHCIDHIMREDLSKNTAIDLGQIFSDKPENSPGVVQVLNNHLKPRIYESNNDTFKGSGTYPKGTQESLRTGGVDETIGTEAPTDTQVTKKVCNESIGDSRISSKPLKDPYKGKPAEVIASEVAVREGLDLNSETVFTLKNSETFYFEQIQENQMHVISPCDGWISIMSEGKLNVRKTKSTSDSRSITPVVEIQV